MQPWRIFSSASARLILACQAGCILTAALLRCGCTLPAQRNREGALRQSLHAEAGNLATR